MNKLKPSLFNQLKPPPPPPQLQPTTTIKSSDAVIRLSSEGAHRDVLLTYASILKNNILPDAYTFQTPTTTIKSLNAVIRLSSEGAHRDVLLTYASILKNNILPDAYTFPSLLKACTSLELISLGFLFHQRVIVNGYSSDAYISSSLINFYSKFGYIDNARHVFDDMPERNVVPWTAIIGCYSRAGDVDMAFSMYSCMRHQGIQPSYVTLLGLSSGISEFTHVQCLHACAIQFGFGSDIALSNSLLNVYGRCGSVQDARDLLESMDHRDVVSWNSLASCYAQIGGVKEILQLLNRMRMEGTEPDHQTFGSAVSASATLGVLELGKLVHGKIVKAGFELDVHVETSLIVMYLKCGNVDDAFLIFEQTQEKDMVLWTAMISGLVQNGIADKALTVFRWMLESRMRLSTATIASALAACAHLGSLYQGASIHGYILRQRIPLDVPALNSLLTLYAKCGHLERSCFVFERMEKKDVVSWNAIVAAHAQNGHLSKAFFLFNGMITALQRPDSLTVVSLLQGCASIGALDQGKWIHNFVIRSCLEPCILVDTALVDMYSKCGALDTAKKCFDQSLEQDLILWSTLIAGYGSHGKGETALRIYSEFLQTGIKPNSVMFLSVLSACSHNGLVDEGLCLLQSMTEDYGIEPKLEHRACIVDLLSRAKRVEEAYIFYKRMFPEPMIDVLGILLDACRTNGNVDLGDIIAKDILMLKPVSAGNYVQLAHSYAALKKWDGVGETWIQMRSLGLTKIPGWSYIELHGTIETFFMNHSSHPQFEEIVLVLKSLSQQMSKMGTELKPSTYQV